MYEDYKVKGIGKATGKKAAREVTEEMIERAGKEAAEELLVHSAKREITEELLEEGVRNSVQEGMELEAKYTTKKYCGDAVFNWGEDAIEREAITTVRQMEHTAGKLTEEGLEDAMENRAMYQVVNQVGDNVENYAVVGAIDGTGTTTSNVTGNIISSKQINQNANISRRVGRPESQTAAESVGQIVKDEAGDTARKDLLENSGDTIKEIKPKNAGDLNINPVHDAGDDNLLEQVVKEGGSGTNIEGAINNGQPRNNHQVVSDGSSLKASNQPPNSSADLLNPDGSVKQRRYYDVDGRAEMDIDFNHTDDGTHEFPHIHLWDWNKNPPRQGSRR